VSRWSSRRTVAVVRIGATSIQYVGADGVAGVPLAVAFDPDSAADSAAVLEPLLAAMLAKAAAARSPVVFDLATELCRFEVVPWVSGLHSREDRLTLARARFDAVYGNGSREWSVELCEGGFGRGGLAVAVPPALPATIVRACLEAGASAAAIRPACVAGINQLLRKAGRKPAWLVVPDGDQAFIGLVRGGGWLSVSAMHVNGKGFFRPLGDLLVRETMLSSEAIGGAAVLISLPPKPPGRPGEESRPAQPPLRTLEAGGQRWALEWIGL